VGLTGVWIGNKKICAFGVQCSRWVTMHGFAFNVNPDLIYFEAIVPCGIRDHGVTSLAEQLGEIPDLVLVKQRLRYHFGDLFEVDVRDVSTIPEWIPPTIR
jgi:lipoyl(octanoyl) transferase